MTREAKGKEEKKEKVTSDLVFNLYAKLFSEIWEIVSALIGEGTLELLFQLSIRKLGQKHPFLFSLKVSEEGILLDEAKKASQELSPAEIHRGFHALVTHLFDLFSAMAEGVVSRELFPKVFPKVREAERILSQK